MASIHETLAAGRKGYAKLVAEDPPRRGVFRRIVLPAALFLVLGGFASIVWLAWRDSVSATGEPPLVRALPGPIKRPPDTPGGVDFEGERHGVATVLGGALPAPRVERLLPREPAPPKTLAEADPALVAPPPSPTPSSPAAPTPGAAGASGVGSSAAAAPLAEPPDPGRTAGPPARETTRPAPSPSPSPGPAADRAGGPASAPQTLAAAEPTRASEPARVPEPARTPGAGREAAPAAESPRPPEPVRAMPVPATTAAPSAAVPVNPPAPAPSAVPAAPTPSGPSAAAAAARPAPAAASPPAASAAAPAPAAAPSAVAALPTTGDAAPGPGAARSAPSSTVAAPTVLSAVPGRPAAPPERLAAREPPAAVPPAVGRGGSWGVQVAAVSSREAAERGWAQLQGRHPEVLGGLQLRVDEARLASGQTLYRLQGLGFPDRESAAQACARLKAAGTECFVVGAR